MSSSAFLFWGVHVLWGSEKLSKHLKALCVQRGLNKPQPYCKTWADFVDGADCESLIKVLLSKGDWQKLEVRIYTTYHEGDDEESQPRIFLAPKELVFSGGSSEYSDEAPTAIVLSKLEVAKRHGQLMDRVLSLLGLPSNATSRRGWWLTSKHYEDT